MNGIDDFIRDFYGKYAPGEQLDDNRIAGIKKYYGDNLNNLIGDLYSKYAPNESITLDRIEGVKKYYGFEEKKSLSGNGSSASLSEQQPTNGVPLADTGIDWSNPAKAAQQLAEMAPKGVIANRDAVNKSDEEPHLQGLSDQDSGSYLGDMGERLLAGGNKLAASIFRIPELVRNLQMLPMDIAIDRTLNKQIAQGNLTEEQARQVGQAVRETLEQNPALAPKEMTRAIAENKVTQWLDNNAEHYRKKSERYNESVGELFKQGRVMEALGSGGLIAMESLPTTLMAAFSGGAGLSLIGLSTAADQMKGLEEMDMDNSAKTINAALYGVAEAVFEKLGTNAIASQIRTILKKQGKQAAIDAVKKSLGASIASNFKQFGKAPAQEMFTEALTTVSQNLVSKYSGEDPDRDILAGIPEALTAAGLTGGVIGGVGQMAIMNREARVLREDLGETQDPIAPQTEMPTEEIIPPKTQENAEINVQQESPQGQTEEEENVKNAEAAQAEQAVLETPERPSPPELEEGRSYVNDEGQKVVYRGQGTGNFLKFEDESGNINEVDQQSEFVAGLKESSAETPQETPSEVPRPKKRKKLTDGFDAQDINDDIAMAFAEGVRITPESYRTWGDPIYMKDNPALRLQYTKSKGKGGTNIDVWAKELAEKWNVDEKEATQAIIDFIHNPESTGDFVRRRIREQESGFAQDPALEGLTDEELAALESKEGGARQEVEEVIRISETALEGLTDKEIDDFNAVINTYADEDGNVDWGRIATDFSNEKVVTDLLGIPKKVYDVLQEQIKANRAAESAAPVGEAAQPQIEGEERKRPVEPTPVTNQEAERAVPPPPSTPIVEEMEDISGPSERITNRIPRIEQTDYLSESVDELTKDDQGQTRTYRQISLEKAEQASERFLNENVDNADNFVEAAKGVMLRLKESLQILSDAAQKVIEGDTKGLDEMNAKARHTATVASIILDKLLFRAVQKGEAELAKNIERYAELTTQAYGSGLVATRSDASPEALFSNTLQKQRKTNQEIRNQPMPDGTTVGETVNAMTEELTKEFGLTKEEIREALGKSVAKSAKTLEGRKRVAEGKKELSTALTKLRKSIAKKAGAGPVIDTETAQALVDTFKAIAKIVGGSIAQVEARFKKEVKNAGLDAAKAWNYLKENNPELFSNPAFNVNALEDLMYGFYKEGKFAGDLKTALQDQFGLDETAASDMASSIQSETKSLIERKKKTRLKQIVASREGNKRRARKVQDAVVEGIVLGGLNDAAIKTAIEEKYGIREISPEDVAELTKIVNEMKALPGDKLKRQKMIDMMDYIQSNIKGESITDVMTAFWYASVLSSLRTQQANLFGNMATSMGIAYRMVMPGGTTGIKNMAQNIGFVMREMGHIWATGRSYKNLDKLIRTATLERISRRSLGQGLNSSVANGLEKAMIIAAKGGRYVGRAMNLVDAFFFYNQTNFRRGQLAWRQAKAEGLTGRVLNDRVNEILALGKVRRNALYDQARQELQASGQEFTDMDVIHRAREITENQLGALDETLVERADEYARKFTLQNKARGFMGMLARLLTMPANMVEEPSQYKGGKKVAAAVAKLYGRMVFPFMNTAANMANQAIDYIPVAGAVYKIAESYVPLRDLSSDLLNTTEDKVIFGIKQAIGLGTTLMLLSHALDDDDESLTITANGPRNYMKRNQLREQGWKPYTIKVGDAQINYRDYPVAGFLALLGALSDSGKYEDAKNLEDRFGLMWAAMGGYFTNSSMLKTIGDLSDAVGAKDPSKALTVITRPVSGYTRPAIVRDIENLISPEYKDRNTFKDIPIIGGFMGNFLSNIPIAGNALLDFKYNSIGEKIKPGEAWWYRGLGFDRAVPYTGKIDPIFELLASKGVFFSNPGRPHIIGVEATHEEWRKFALVMGRYRKMVLSDMIENNQDDLWELDRETLSSVINDIDKGGRDLAESLVYLYSQNDQLKGLTPSEIDDILYGRKEAPEVD